MFAALSTPVTVATLALLGVIASAVIAGFFQLRAAKAAVGKPNGQGPVVTMLENVLKAVGRIEEVQAGHGAKLEEHTAAIAAMTVQQ